MRVWKGWAYELFYPLGDRVYCLAVGLWENVSDYPPPELVALSVMAEGEYAYISTTGPEKGDSVLAMKQFWLEHSDPLAELKKTFDALPDLR